MGAGRGDREPVLGKQSGGAGEGGQLPGQADQPERRGQAPLPHGPAIKGRIPPARLPARSPTSGKCTSHLGFGLENRCLTTGTRKPRLNKPLRISSKTTIPSWLAPYLRSSDHDQRSHRSVGDSSVAADAISRQHFHCAIRGWYLAKICCHQSGVRGSSGCAEGLKPVRW